MAKSLTPLHLPHSGEILRTEFLEPMGVTQYRLAMDLKIPHSRAISPDTALRLSHYFGTSAEFWIDLQQEFDLRKARAETGKDIESQVSPLAV